MIRTSTILLVFFILGCNSRKDSTASWNSYLSEILYRIEFQFNLIENLDEPRIGFSEYSHGYFDPFALELNHYCTNLLVFERVVSKYGKSQNHEIVRLIAWSIPTDPTYGMETLKTMGPLRENDVFHSTKKLVKSKFNIMFPGISDEISGLFWAGAQHDEYAELLDNYYSLEYRLFPPEETLSPLNELLNGDTQQDDSDADLTSDNFHSGVGGFATLSTPAFQSSDAVR